MLSLVMQVVYAPTLQQFLSLALHLAFCTIPLNKSHILQEPLFPCLIYKDECLYVCLYLIQIHISEPIGTKLCTHLPRGLEETIGYVWAHISPFPPFRPILSGAHADSCAVDGCRHHTALLLPYIRGAARAGVTSQTAVGCAMKIRRSEWNACVCKNGNLMRREVTNELHLQLHCIYTNNNVKPI